MSYFCEFEKISVFFCKQSADFYGFSNVLFLFLFSKVFHVRSVTQGDVIRAEAKDIPRIFQVIKKL